MFKTKNKNVDRIPGKFELYIKPEPQADPQAEGQLVEGVTSVCVDKQRKRMQSSEEPKRMYRYSLRRTFKRENGTINEKNNHLMIIGCNPSNATQDRSDPTMDQVTEIAYRNGYDGVIMCNLFAYIDSSPRKMKEAAEKALREKKTSVKSVFENFLAGPDNVKELEEAAKLVEDVVLAFGNIAMTGWKDIGNGNNGAYEHASTLICNIWKGLGKRVMVFNLTKSGFPMHPSPRKVILKQQIKDSRKDTWITWAELNYLAEDEEHNIDHEEDPDDDEPME